MDDNFLRQLQALKAAGDRVMPGVMAAAKKGNYPNGTRKSLQAQVSERCEFGMMGFKLAEITGSPLADKGPARRRTPPIKDGMTYCIDTVLEKVTAKEQPGNADFSQITSLLRRIKHLVRVFYDCKVKKVQTHELLTYCDFTTIFDVSMKLNQIGLYLQLDPPRLRALMAAGGKGLETFVLDEPLDIGPYRQELSRINKILEDDEEADDEDREAVQTIDDLATQDLAAHIMVWFFANLHVAFVLNEPRSDAERTWKEKALRRLVKWSTSLTWRDVLGDPLTDAMRPIYWNKDALVAFSHAGGLASLYGDWVNSSCRDICEESMLSLPSAAWENQTRSSLKAITRELQNKESHEAKEDVAGPVFINTFFNIYRRYGLPPFKAAANSETWQTSVLFYFIQHRIKNDAGLASLLQTTKSGWDKLIKEYIDLPDSTERRYKWTNLKISGQWDCLEYYGCDNKDCAEKKVLLEARKRRVRGVRDKEMEDRLHRWGAKSQSCSGCLGTSYCSPACQKAHWPSHKSDCLRKRKTRAR